MARKIVIPIPDFTYTEKTYLDADYSSGTALTVVNNYGFALNDILIAGEPGEEKTESRPVTSQTGNTVVNITGSLKFSHEKSDIIYRFEYDQYEIYRYRSSAWSLISTSNIQWDKLDTIYIDTDGQSTDSYRYRLLNSVSAAVSDYSPTIPATGFTRAQAGYMLENVRKILGDQERKIVSDDELLRKFNEAQDIVKSKRKDWWFLRKESAGQITTLINTQKYGLNTYLSDLNYIDTIRYRYNDGTTDTKYELEVISMTEMDALVQDGNATTDDYPELATILPPDDSDATGYIFIDKKTKTTNYGSFYVRYYKTMTDLDDVMDATLVPIPSILEAYALSYGFALKNDTVRSKMYEDEFYGPQGGRQEKARAQTGIRLLEIMQDGKGKALGSLPSLKRFRGRNAIRRYFKDHAVDRDSLAEKYF